MSGGKSMRLFTKPRGDGVTRIRNVRFRLPHGSAEELPRTQGTAKKQTHYGGES